MKGKLSILDIPPVLYLTLVTDRGGRSGVSGSTSFFLYILPPYVIRPLRWRKNPDKERVKSF